MKNGHKSESDRRMDRIERAFEVSSRRMDRIERVVAQNNRIVSALAVSGRRLRSDVRRHEKWLEEHERNMAEHERMMARHDLVMAEINDKLNGLIGYVDALPRPR